MLKMLQRCPSNQSTALTKCRQRDHVDVLNTAVSSNLLLNVQLAIHLSSSLWPPERSEEPDPSTRLP